MQLRNKFCPCSPFVEVSVERRRCEHELFHLLVDSKGVLCKCSGNKDTDATGGSDSLLGEAGEFLGSDDAWDVGESSFTEHLEVAL